MGLASARWVSSMVGGPARWEAQVCVGVLCASSRGRKGHWVLPTRLQVQAYCRLNVYITHSYRIAVTFCAGAYLCSISCGEAIDVDDKAGFLTKRVHMVLAPTADSCSQLLVHSLSLQGSGAVLCPIGRNMLLEAH